MTSPSIEHQHESPLEILGRDCSSLRCQGHHGVTYQYPFNPTYATSKIPKHHCLGLLVHPLYGILWTSCLLRSHWILAHLFPQRTGFGKGFCNGIVQSLQFRQLHYPTSRRVLGRLLLGSVQNHLAVLHSLCARDGNMCDFILPTLSIDLPKSNDMDVSPWFVWRCRYWEWWYQTKRSDFGRRSIWREGSFTKCWKGSIFQLFLLVHQHWCNVFLRLLDHGKWSFDAVMFWNGIVHNVEVGLDWCPIWLWVNSDWPMPMLCLPLVLLWFQCSCQFSLRSTVNPVWVCRKNMVFLLRLWYLVVPCWLLCLSFLVDRLGITNCHPAAVPLHDLYEYLWKQPKILNWAARFYLVCF